MLVINGINSRTNAHAAGRLFNHAGSSKTAHPIYQPCMPAHKIKALLCRLWCMAMRLWGQSCRSHKIIPRYFSNCRTNVRTPGQATQWLANDDLAAIKALQTERAASLKDGKLQLAKQQQQISEYYDSVFADTEGFKNFTALYMGLNEGDYLKDNYTDAIKFALTAFTTGLGVSADVSFGGFDTHDEHDVRSVKAMDDLTNAANLLWHYAEQLGISDRLVVSLASDFGRTPITTTAAARITGPMAAPFLCKKNAPWTNRVIGKTTELHKALKINPSTLQVDPNGIELEPSHVHQNLRNHLGIASNPAALRFKLNANTPIDFFNSTAQTA